MYRGGESITQDDIHAHMWGNVAASNGIEQGSESKNFVADEMTPAEIAAAKKLAVECVAKDYKGC